MSLENIELPGGKTSKGAGEENVSADTEMTMAVSPVCVKDGKQYAFVSFTEGTKTAEGRIPECVIVSNKGFNETELAHLETFMRRELTGLKKMASGINVLGAFMKDHAK